MATNGSPASYRGRTPEEESRGLRFGYPLGVDPNPSRLTPTDAESRDLIQGAFADDGVDLTQISWFLGLTPGERLAAAQDFLDGLMELRDGREPDDPVSAAP